MLSVRWANSILSSLLSAFLLLLFPAAATGSNHFQFGYRYKCHDGWNDDGDLGRVNIGGRLGCGYSRISGIQGCLESGVLRPTYTFSESGVFFPVFFLFSNYRLKNVGAELEAGSERVGDVLVKDYTNRNLSEEYAFGYQYFSTGLYLKFYFRNCFYFGAGCRMSWCLNRNGVRFSSTRSALYSQSDGQTEERIQESLSGKMVTSSGLKLGWESERGWAVELSYHQSLNDAVRTNTNEYGYTEEKNPSQSVELTIGYSLTIWDRRSQKSKSRRVQRHWHHKYDK
jgi:hypothetical protein